MGKKELINQYREICKKLKAYSLAFNILYFDNSTIAPKKSLNEKAELEGILSMEYYKIATSSEYLNCIDSLYQMKDSLTADMKREIELEKKSIDNIRRIPQDLYQEDSVLRTKSYMAWLEAKEKNDYSIFAPFLKRTIEIRKEYARLFGAIDGSLYNTWLNEYEEGMTIKTLDKFFDTIKKRITQLLNKIDKSKVIINDDFTKCKVRHDKQMDITKYVLKMIGFDFSRGVISETEHPFTEEISYNDVRITTHIYENMFFSNIFSTIHEGGHALYDQNLAKNLEITELRDGTSMAIHESQSRFYENVIGRSKAFIDNIYKKVNSKLASPYKDHISPEDMFLAANKVERSLIRTEADELTYSLHIMIRYEMEKKIIDGDVDVMELPKIWKELYKEYLGIDVPNDTLGILQDSHWAGGSFGYFPSYALGNAYGLQILNTMEKEFNVNEVVSEGKIKKINKWLKDNVYIYGKRVTPSELIKLVTNEELNPNYYCDYLEKKFKEIYKIK